MGYFSELETDVLDMYCAEVPVERIAEEFGISVRVGRKDRTQMGTGQR